jgi:hypothetical protein
VESSLGQADNENLDLITHRILQTQAAAETSVSQIQVTMPICGQVLRFDSPVQVEPAAEMAVAFSARPQHLAKVDPSLWYGFGLFGLLLGGGALVNWTRCRWTVLCGAWDQVPTVSAQPSKSAESTESSGPDGQDEPPSQISADELL